MTEHRQKLIIICGLPGVGKTTVAHALARRINAVVITSEKIVSELFRNTKNARQDKDWTPQELARGYSELFSREEKMLKAGRTTIVEGSFRFYRQRTRATTIAEKLSIPHMVIYVTCSSKILKQRLEQRFMSTRHQFGYQAHLAVKRVYEPVKHPDFILDSSGNINKQIDDVLKVLKTGDRVEVDANKGVVRKV